VFVLLGMINPDRNSVDVHTIEDWLPVIVLNVGTFLWLSNLVQTRREANVIVKAWDGES
jgi:hypothetical protein